ncbi:MAG: hypothetical protein KZQ90_07975 [Candidatus Thiodiazotropha sp. (ex Codakia rugifera)]|nr:hypothetical protein [Candidatus Thiodiazotropha sp. (ex Codakia rugifera)]
MPKSTLISIVQCGILNRNRQKVLRPLKQLDHRIYHSCFGYQAEGWVQTSMMDGFIMLSNAKSDN